MSFWPVLLLPALVTLGNLEPTARPEASGFAAVAAITGAEALFGNPAGIFAPGFLSAVAGYRAWYELSELKTLQAGVAMGRHRWATGFGIWRKSAGNFYAETQALWTLALRWRSLQVACRPRWFQVAVRDSGETWSRYAWLLDAGVRWQHGPAAVGFHVENLTSRRLQLLETSQRLARRTILALAWRLPANVTWSAAYVNWNGQPLYRVGVEAWFTRGFALRLGVDEKYLTLGMGLTDGQWSFDFTGRNVFPMGAVYTVSLGYRR